MRVMLLRRSLPQFADPRVTTDRHCGRLPLSVIDAISPVRTKPANPWGLNHSGSNKYVRIEALQTHCAYLNCFQCLIGRKEAFFWKRGVVLRTLVVSNQSEAGGYMRSGRQRSRSGCTPRAEKTCPRTKLEGHLESAAYRERSKRLFSGIGEIRKRSHVTRYTSGE